MMLLKIQVAQLDKVHFSNENNKENRSWQMEKSNIIIALCILDK